MAKQASNAEISSAAEPSNATNASGNGKYTVVARRYRPKTFAELVGQSTVAQALLSAIESNRVGHAYLFTGARGVGKTSTARIFAKALNASAEADGKFDPNSDTALAIDSGEDMDVLEIDGASNRGIDEIRQLRANAAVRPSRSRYKIYIIDEVHMLTTQAFNALLKTLEEPPGHVKFIFCTTDPEKMPITVLSRCQRFDFPPVQTEQIYERLKFICENEGTKADEGALRLIARRAAGSMRDSQSLLEQLLSFGGNEITADVVHSMLGTADETRLATFASRLIERDAAGALGELDQAASQGVDVGQLAEQLLGYLRDMMAVSVGGAADLIRTANPGSVDQLREWGNTWGTMTLLSALQLLDETIVKMRHSVQSRVLLEVALVQICNLQDLQSLSELVKAFAANQPANAPRPSGAPRVSAPQAPASVQDSKKKDELKPTVLSTTTPAPKPNAAPAASNQVIASTEHPSPPAVSLRVQEPAPPSTDVQAYRATAPVAASQSDFPQIAVTGGKEVTKTNAADTDSQTDEKHKDAPKPATASSSDQDPLEILRETANKLGGFAGQCAALTVRVETPTDHQWKICLSRDGDAIQKYFQTGDNGKRLSQALRQRLGRGVHLEFCVTNEASPHVDTAQPAQSVVAVSVQEHYTPAVPQAQLIRNAMLNPLVKQFMDVFEGQILRVDPVQLSVPAPKLEQIETKPDSQTADAEEPAYETADAE